MQDWRSRYCARNARAKHAERNVSSPAGDEPLPNVFSRCLDTHHIFLTLHTLHLLQDTPSPPTSRPPSPPPNVLGRVTLEVINYKGELGNWKPPLLTSTKIGALTYWSRKEEDAFPERLKMKANFLNEKGLPLLQRELSDYKDTMGLLVRNVLDVTQYCDHQDPVKRKLANSLLAKRHCWMARSQGLWQAEYFLLGKYNKARRRWNNDGKPRKHLAACKRERSQSLLPKTEADGSLPKRGKDNRSSNEGMSDLDLIPSHCCVKIAGDGGEGRSSSCSWLRRWRIGRRAFRSAVSQKLLQGAGEEQY